MLYAFFVVADLIPLLVFIGIVALIWSILSMISQRNTRSMERLARLRRPPSLAEVEAPQSKAERFAGLIDAAKSLSSPLMPQSELEQSALKTKLANAGFRSDAAPMIYSGIRFATFLAFSLAGILIFIPGAENPFDFHTVKWVIIMAGVGFYLPSIILWWIKRKRQEAIFLSLPDALDLLVVCVESVLGLDAAMRKVTDEMGDHAKVICE